jgi:hypothetical protein
VNARRAWQVLLAGTLLALLAACAKPVPAEHRDMVGLWEAPEMRLLITADGSLDYKRVQGGSSVSINAPIQQIRADGFSAGLGPMSTEFRIDQRPKLVDGVWTMKVDGVLLRRTDAPATPPAI